MQSSDLSDLTVLRDVKVVARLWADSRLQDEANKRWQKLSERFPKALVVWASHEALNPRRTKARTDQKRYCYKYQRGRQDERKATQLCGRTLMDPRRAERRHWIGFDLP